MSIYLTQGLHRALQRRPEAIATVFQGRHRTFAEQADRVARLAAGLQGIGMREGDRVGMLAHNSDRYLEFYLGTWWGGGSVNPCNTRWSAAEVAYSLQDSDTRILIVDDAFQSMVAELKRRSSCLAIVIYAGEGSTPQGMLSYESLIEQAKPVEDMRRGGGSVAGIFYTGGTSGFPKGVALTHAGLFSSLQSIIGEVGGAPEPIYLHAAPMFHLADASFAFIQVIRCGGHVMVPTFSPQRVLEAIQAERVTTMLLVPTMVQMLLDHPDVARYDVSSLKFLHYGGSPITEAVLRRGLEIFPDVKFVQGYGLTELSPVATMLGPEYHVLEGPNAGKLRSAGRAVSCCEIRIVGPDGREVPRGSVGEITARGPHLMEGYWGKPELTAQAVRDGWFHTGDGAYMDDEGFVFIVDRLKEMIVTGGENVYSAEVENALMQHPAIAVCAVIAVPDEKWGERVHAVVVPKGEARPSGEELLAHCRTLIANYKCPRSVEYRDSLPMSGAGKVLKSVLRDPYWNGVERKVQ